MDAVFTFIAAFVCATVGSYAIGSGIAGFVALDDSKFYWRSIASMMLGYVLWFVLFRYLV